MTGSPCDDGERQLAIVKSHVAQLADHFEAVQVFVTKQGEDGTINCHYGAGNWFARYGQVRAWVAREDARMHKEIIDDD